MSITRATILQIALAIENKGIAFYSAAARRFADPLIEWLIGEEKRHIRVFQGIFGQDGGRIREGEDALFACGPNAMLAALASWVEGRDLPCEVSLETQFGCGTGICAGCAVPVRGRPAARGAGQEVPHEAGHGSGQVGSQDTGGGRPATDFDRYVFACREGPVFPAEIVEWEGLHE